MIDQLPDELPQPVAEALFDMTWILSKVREVGRTELMPSLDHPMSSFIMGSLMGALASAFKDDPVGMAETVRNTARNIREFEEQFGRRRG